jgi:hypothetical protein
MKYLTLNNSLAVFSLACNVVGSILLAANTGHMALGYMFFIAGVIPGTYLLLVSSVNKILVLTNIYFFAINIFGLYRHW